MNSANVRYLGQSLLSDLFNYLEFTQGGDGMGVAALFSSNGKVRTHRSVYMLADEAAAHLVRWEKQGADYFVFHTRMATHGSVCTANCHPFRHGGLVLAHNGVATEFGNMLDDRTDSEAICLTLQRTRMKTDFLMEMTGVFVGFRDGRPFVVKGQTTSSLMFASMGRAWVFSSALPRAFEEVYPAERANIGTLLWEGATKKGLPVLPQKDPLRGASLRWEMLDQEDAARDVIEQRKKTKRIKKMKAKLRTMSQEERDRFVADWQAHHAPPQKPAPKPSTNTWVTSSSNQLTLKDPVPIVPGGVQSPLCTSILVRGDVIKAGDSFNTREEDIVYEGGLRFTGSYTGEVFFLVRNALQRPSEETASKWPITTNA